MLPHHEGNVCTGIENDFLDNFNGNSHVTYEMWTMTLQYHTTKIIKILNCKGPNMEYDAG